MMLERQRSSYGVLLAAVLEHLFTIIVEIQAVRQDLGKTLPADGSVLNPSPTNLTLRISAFRVS